MKRGILFLDFDGVMHPFGCTIDTILLSPRLASPRLALLEDWLRLRQGVDVVISSSWREVHPLDEMRNYFSPDLQHRVLGAAPLIQRDSWRQFDGEPPPVRFEREEEVRRWLHQSGQSWQSWAAVDDQTWLFRPSCRWLVVCDGKVGVTPRELNLVDRLLALRS